MGREWYWNGKSSKRSPNGGGGDQRETTYSSGCMSAVFQFFDFNHSRFVLNHRWKPTFHPTSILPNKPPLLPKGTQAPRNSLELSDDSSLSPITKQENLHIPVGIIKIKTTTTAAPNDISSDSPSTKTPNLVARLMGLDLLPETYSPSSNLTTPHINPLSRPHLNPLHVRVKSCVDHSLSLPETPRVSSARRSDASDYHPRLSLQIINKENVRNVNDELELSRFSSSGLRRSDLLKIEHDHDRSPGYYAKQIVKQVKQSVSRKVNGLSDITNTMRLNCEHKGKDHEKSKKLSSKGFKKAVDHENCSTLSSSPRVRCLDGKNNNPITSISSSSSTCTEEKNLQPLKQNLSTTSSTNIDPVQVQTSKVSHVKPKPKCQTLMQEQKNKRGANERFGTRLMKLSQKEEAFVRSSIVKKAVDNIPEKQCKKKSTLLSDHLLNLSSNPNLFPVWKDPLPPATKTPQKQESQKKGSYIPIIQENNSNKNTIKSTNTTVPESTAEFQYITRIISRTGITNDTPVAFTFWFSPSHPLDPSIFTSLENTGNYNSESTFHKSNGKLMFHLVDELLVEILKPHINMKLWIKCNYKILMHGSKLIETLWDKVRSFPRANCEVLEDIDALIEKDLSGNYKIRSLMETGFEEEGNGVVKEIEKEILESLVHETAEMVFLLGPY